MKLLILAIAILQSCAPAPSAVVDSHGDGIINGQTINARTTNASKSVVALRLLNSQGQFLTFCTGTLIAVDTVLTAAHCLDQSALKGLTSIEVVFANRVGATTAPSTFKINTKIFAMHPAYNTEGYPTYVNVLKHRRWIKNPILKFGVNHDHDIGVVVFDKKLFGGKLPAGFAAATMSRDQQTNLALKTVFVYGYGRTADYGTPKEPSFWDLYGTLHRGKLSITTDFTTANNRYLSEPSDGAFTCQGDSGGPQFVDSPAGPVIVGVNSLSGNNLAGAYAQSCRGTSTATFVPNFATWVDEAQSRLRLMNQ